eukprot:3064555-Rhodomonas_salina.2
MRRDQVEEMQPLKLKGCWPCPPDSKPATHAPPRAVPCNSIGSVQLQGQCRADGKNVDCFWVIDSMSRDSDAKIPVTVGPQGSLPSGRLTSFARIRISMAL